MTNTRPSNYDELTHGQKAIVDEHIRAGYQPPPMTPPSREQIERTRNGAPTNLDAIPED